ncbi:winged helix-turn-helix domain-containing protein [Glutamicibacter sp. MCAF14]|uniref:winged helix-turn-helix domain-containing protein n=1 Tax=Glutamicibacter sp. MCAF14 TaxID=3233043 RepID=UPI003F9082B0
MKTEMMDAMPRVSAQAMNQPAVLDIFSSAIAREITRWLATHGPATTSKIADALQRRQLTALRALTMLENHGVVSGYPGAGDRTGSVVTWTYHAAPTRNAVKQLRQYVTGGEMPESDLPS